MEIEDMLGHLESFKKEKHSEIVQFRISRRLKEEVFEILSERDFDLSTVLRSYLENLVKNHYERNSSSKSYKARSTYGRDAGILD